MHPVVLSPRFTQYTQFKFVKDGFRLYFENFFRRQRELFLEKDSLTFAKHRVDVAQALEVVAQGVKKLDPICRFHLLNIIFSPSLPLLSTSFSFHLRTRIFSHSLPLLSTSFLFTNKLMFFHKFAFICSCAVHPDIFISVAQEQIITERINLAATALDGIGKVTLFVLNPITWFNKTRSWATTGGTFIGQKAQLVLAGAYDHFNEQFYQSENVKICREFEETIEIYENVPEVSDSPHWLKRFFSQIGVDLAYFYLRTRKTNEWTFQQKNRLLRSVYALNTARTTPGLRMSLKISFFPILVDTVFRECSLQNLLRGTSDSSGEMRQDPETILALLKEKEHRILNLWSFIAYLDKKNEHGLLETFFITCPPFLQFFLRAIDDKILTAKDLNTPETVEALSRMRQLMEAHPYFLLAFSNGKLDQQIKNLPAPLTVSNMEAAFNKLVSVAIELTDSLKIKIETDAAKVKEELRTFLSGKGVDKTVIKEFFKDYSDRYRVYGAKAWIAGLESCMLSDVFEVKRDWIRALKVLVIPGGGSLNRSGKNARKALSQACFKNYMGILAQRADYQDPWGLAEEFYKALHPMIDRLNDRDSPVETNLAMLENVTTLIFFSIRLIQKGASSKELFLCLRKFCKENLRNLEAFQDKAHLKAVQELLSVKTNPALVREIEHDREGRIVINIPPLKRRVNVDKIRENLQKEPFLLLTHVAPHFIRAFLPGITPIRLEGFTKALQLCKVPFERSPLAKELLEVANLIVTDPFVLTVLSSSHTLLYAKEYFDNLIVQLNSLFFPIARGEKELGGSLTEKEMAGLIEEIVNIRKIKKDSAQLSAKQKLFLEQAPSWAEKICTVSDLLNRTASFLNWKVGSFNVGQAVAITGAQVATNIVSSVGDFVSKFLPAISDKKAEGVVEEMPLVKPFSAAKEQAKPEEPNVVATLLKLVECVEEDKMITKYEKDRIVFSINEHVIPLVAEMVPVLQEHHDFGSYAKIFKEMSAIIQANDESKIEEDRIRLAQLIALLAIQVPKEIEQYMEALDAVYQALIYLEHYPRDSWTSPWASPMGNREQPVARPRLLLAETTAGTTTATIDDSSKTG